MNIDLLREFFAWCSLLNIGLLAIWALIFWQNPQWIFRAHRHFFKLSDEQFTRLNYLAMAGYKLAIILFNLVPYLVLSLIA